MESSGYDKDHVYSTTRNAYYVSKRSFATLDLAKYHIWENTGKGKTAMSKIHALERRERTLDREINKLNHKISHLELKIWKDIEYIWRSRPFGKNNYG